MHPLIWAPCRNIWKCTVEKSQTFVDDDGGIRISFPGRNHQWIWSMEVSYFQSMFLYFAKGVFPLGKCDDDQWWWWWFGIRISFPGRNHQWIWSIAVWLGFLVFSKCVSVFRKKFISRISPWNMWWWWCWYKNKFSRAQSPMDLINGSLAWHCCHQAPTPFTKFGIKSPI